MTIQTVPVDATHCYKHLKMLLIATNMSAQESPKSELRLKSYEGLKLID
jgi:hypothetical protein